MAVLVRKNVRNVFGMTIAKPLVVLYAITHDLLNIDLMPGNIFSHSWQVYINITFRTSSQKVIKNILRSRFQIAF